MYDTAPLNPTELGLHTARDWVVKRYPARKPQKIGVPYLACTNHLGGWEIRVQRWPWLPYGPGYRWDIQHTDDRSVRAFGYEQDPDRLAIVVQGIMGIYVTQTPQ